MSNNYNLLKYKRVEYVLIPTIVVYWASKDLACWLDSLIHAQLVALARFQASPSSFYYQMRSPMYAVE